MLDPDKCSPWILEVPVAATSVNGSAPAPGGLVNPSIGPVFVDEFRFTGIPTYRINTRVTIKIGQVIVCDDVPLTTLCKPLDRSLDGIPNGILGPFSGENLSSIGYEQSYVWRLPRPLLLPRGGQMSVTLRSAVILGVGDPLTLTGFVSAVGRTLPEEYPLPQEVDVPFATHWTVSGNVVTGITLVSDQSNLKNRFDAPLRIRRFTLDLAKDGTASLGLGLQETIDNYGLAAFGLLRIYGQNGVLGVRDQTPAGVLASYGRRSWTVDSVLGPLGYLIAELSYPSPGGSSTAPKLAFSLAMVGVHKEPLTMLGVE